MKQARLDIAPGGEWIVPFGKRKLRNLRAFAIVSGLTFSQKRWYVGNVTLTVTYNAFGLDRIEVEVGGFFALAEYISDTFIVAMASYLHNGFEASRSFTITHPHTMPWMKPDGTGAVVLAENDGLGNASFQRIGGNRRRQGEPILIAGTMAGSVTTPSRNVTEFYHGVDDGDWTVHVYNLADESRIAHTVATAVSGNFQVLEGVSRHSDRRAVFRVEQYDAGIGVIVYVDKYVAGTWTMFTPILFADVAGELTLQGGVGSSEFQPESMTIDDNGNVYYVLGVPINLGTTYESISIRLYQSGAPVLTLGTLSYYSNPAVTAAFGSNTFNDAYRAALHADRTSSVLLVSAWGLGGALVYHDAAVWLVVAGSATLVQSTTLGASNTVKPTGLGVTADGSKFCVTKGTDAYFYEEVAATPGTFALAATVALTRNIWNDGDQYWYNTSTGNFTYMDHANNKLYGVTPTGETLLGTFTSGATATVEGTDYTFNEAAQRGSVSVATDLA